MIFVNSLKLCWCFGFGCFVFIAWNNSFCLYVCVYCMKSKKFLTVFLQVYCFFLHWYSLRRDINYSKREFFWGIRLRVVWRNSSGYVFSFRQDFCYTSNLLFVHSFMQFLLNCVRDVFFFLSGANFVHPRDKDFDHALLPHSDVYFSLL